MSETECSECAWRFTSGQFGESHTARSSEADSSCISQLSSGMRGDSQALRKSEAFSKWLGQKELVKKTF